MVLSYWENLPGETFEGFGMFPELQNIRGEFMQCYLFAPKGHPYLKAVIEQVVSEIQSYSRMFHGVGLMGVLRVTGSIVFSKTTGSIVFSKTIIPILHLYPHKLVNIQKLGFVYSIYNENPLRGHNQLFKNHYSDLTESIVCLGKPIR